MHWNNLTIGGEFYILGRGTVLSVDLNESGITEDSYIKEIPIKTSDTLDYNDNSYIVVGVESFSNLLDGKYSSKIGLIVRQLNKINDKHA